MTSPAGTLIETDPDPVEAGWTPGRVGALLTRLPIARDRPLVGYAAAIALSVIATLVRWLADGMLPPGFPFVSFFPAVIVSAFLFGLRPGILAGVLGGLLSWYFFITPHREFGMSPGAAVALAFYAGVVVIDIALIHLMQLANARLAAERERGMELARHREVLFAELQHRVGNNIQMSASLLALQKRKLVDPAARAAIDEAAQRLGMIGRVQRQLYDPTGAQLDLATFLGALARDVLSTAGREDLSLTLDAAPGVTLSPNAAIPTALIFSEVLANAVEHGFAGSRPGSIVVTMRRHDDALEIDVEDDGAGLPPDFDTDANGNLGLRICTTLARSLGGSFTIEQREIGCRARLRFASA